MHAVLLSTAGCCCCCRGPLWGFEWLLLPVRASSSGGPLLEAHSRWMHQATTWPLLLLLLLPCRPLLGSSSRGRWPWRVSMRLGGLRLPCRLQLLVLVHAGGGRTHWLLLLLPPSALRHACLLRLGCWPNRRKNQRVHCLLLLLRAVCCAEAHAWLLLQLLPMLLPVLVVLKLLLLLCCLRIPTHRPERQPALFACRRRVGSCRLLRLLGWAGGALGCSCYNACKPRVAAA